mmetsp:Transcript_49703/g.94991  ORF Transcript_49703/g.94991 Transcript_49703/m.94991 type:complete len:312 (+) Transcript_49703:268-1203(+)
MHFLGLLLIRDGPVLAGVDVGALLLRQVLRKVLGHHGSGLQFGGEEALGAHLAQVGGGARLGLRLLQRVGARLLRVEVLPLTHARPGLLQVDALHARLQLRPAADPHAHGRVLQHELALVRLPGHLARLRVQHRVEVEVVHHHLGPPPLRVTHPVLVLLRRRRIARRQDAAVVGEPGLEEAPAVLGALEHGLEQVRVLGVALHHRLEVFVLHPRVLQLLAPRPGGLLLVLDVLVGLRGERVLEAARVALGRLEALARRHQARGAQLLDHLRRHELPAAVRVARQELLLLLFAAGVIQVRQRVHVLEMEVPL